MKRLNEVKKIERNYLEDFLKEEEEPKQLFRGDSRPSYNIFGDTKLGFRASKSFRKKKYNYEHIFEHVMANGGKRFIVSTSKSKDTARDVSRKITGRDTKLYTIDARGLEYVDIQEVYKEKHWNNKNNESEVGFKYIPVGNIIKAKDVESKTVVYNPFYEGHALNESDVEYVEHDVGERRKAVVTKNRPLKPGGLAPEWIVARQKMRENLRELLSDFGEFGENTAKMLSTVVDKLEPEVQEEVHGKLESLVKHLSKESLAPMALVGLASIICRLTTRAKKEALEAFWKQLGSLPEESQEAALDQLITACKYSPEICAPLLKTAAPLRKYDSALKRYQPHRLESKIIFGIERNLLEKPNANNLKRLLGVKESEAQKICDALLSGKTDDFKESIKILSGRAGGKIENLIVKKFSEKSDFLKSNNHMIKENAIGKLLGWEKRKQGERFYFNNFTEEDIRQFGRVFGGLSKVLDGDEIYELMRFKFNLKNAFREAYRNFGAGRKDSLRSLVSFMEIICESAAFMEDPNYKKLRKELYNDIHAAQKGFLFNTGDYNKVKEDRERDGGQTLRQRIKEIKGSLENDVPCYKKLPHNYS